MWPYVLVGGCILWLLVSVFILAWLHARDKLTCNEYGNPSKADTYAWIVFSPVIYPTIIIFKGLWFLGACAVKVVQLCYGCLYKFFRVRYAMKRNKEIYDSLNINPDSIHTHGDGYDSYHPHDR